MRRINKTWALWLIMAMMVGFLGCKPKDSDIEQSIATAIASYPGVSVTVKDGVATLTGEAADEATRAAIEAAAKAVKGVKSVSNSLTLPPPPPPPAPVVINPDEALQKSVSDLLTGSTYSKVKADIKEGVVTLTGEIKKADLPGLIQKLNEMKPKKVENKLVIK